MSFKETFYPESRFGGFTRLDGTIAFYLRIAALLEPSSVLLDVGCGRGAYSKDAIAVRRNLRIFKGRVARVIGIDASREAEANPYLDEFHLLEADNWPLSDDSVDVCVCDSVLEHVEHPDSFFSESRRVLRNGGYLCIRTPNAWGYVALFSKLTPERRHVTILSRVQAPEDRKEEQDIFPTHYRCNTIPELRRMLGGHGFEHAVYGHAAEPSYLHFSKIAYWLGVLHQRFAPGFLRPALFAFGKVAK